MSPPFFKLSPSKAIFCMNSLIGEPARNRNVSGCGTQDYYYVVKLMVEPMFWLQREKEKQGTLFDHKRAPKLDSRESQINLSFITDPSRQIVHFKIGVFVVKMRAHTGNTIFVTHTDNIIDTNGESGLHDEDVLIPDLFKEELESDVAYEPLEAPER
uniref:Uncharacterized protein n=1 Tax=Tetranychus urticae TaxID=32264 RepID=T1K0F3_TETUR